VNIYLLLLVIIIPTSIAAWAVRLRMRRRVKMALGIKPATEAELTSLSTWMRVGNEEDRNRVTTISEGPPRQDNSLLTAVYLTAAKDVSLPVRQGRKLVLPLGSELPPLCLKCGKPAAAYKELVLTWFPEATNVIYLLVGVLALRKVRVSLPLCSAHFWHRGALKLGGVLFVLAAIPVGAFAAVDLSLGLALVLLIGVLTLVGGCLMWWKSEVLHIRQLSDSEIVFTGASEEFLNMLPLRNHFG